MEAGALQARSETSVSSPWPPGFPRVPDEDWTKRPVEPRAAGYDQVETHGWYANLDPTVEDVVERLQDGAIAVDYSGGTGILIDRVLQKASETRFGIVNVDASAKFLRLALEKHRDAERVAFRRLHYLKDEGRLQLLHEVLDPALGDGGVDVLTSTNAIHLYHDLHDTLESWHRVLRPGGTALVQSGNIHREDRPADRWSIDATVDAVVDAAKDIVEEEPRYAHHRTILQDAERMEAHRDLRNRFFVPLRPLTFYLDALETAGFTIADVTHRPIPVDVAEWREFLRVYDEGFLGWIGGTERVEGHPASTEHLTHRGEVLDAAIARVFDGAEEFTAEWTYVTCER